MDWLKANWGKVLIGATVALDSILIVAMTQPILLVFLVPIGVYLLCCIRQLEPDEHGCKVRLGKPRAHVGSGLCFVWLFLEDIIIVTKNLILLDFAKHQVMTKADPDGKIGPVEIIVDSTLTFYWSDDDTLKNAIERLPRNVFTNNEQATKYFSQFVLAAIREAAGTKSWVETIQNRKGFYNIALKHLCKVSKITDLGVKGDFSFDIKDIDFTEEMKISLNRQEKARMELLAAEHEGDAEKVRIIKKGEGEADATKKKGEAEADAKQKMGAAEADARERMLKTVKEAGADLEVLYTLREMAQGTSNTILYQIPQGIYDRLGTLLGGNTPEQTLKALFPDATDAFIRGIVDKARDNEIIT